MITLINPSSDVETRKIRFSTPPLGLAYLASSLREAGFRVGIIDNMVENLGFEELVGRLGNSLIVGITSTTPTFKSALRYAEVIKKAIPEAFVILGGVHASFMPVKALKSGNVDAVCVGEGEKTMVEVAERIEKSKSLEGVRGLYYREGSRIVFWGERPFSENLDEIPFPAYDLLPMDRYSVVGMKLEHFPVVTSRGCPFGCIYCATSAFMGTRFRNKSARYVLDELEWLGEKFGARNIAISDDTFTLNRKRVQEICRGIRERGLDINWSCSSRVDTVNREILEEMRKSGCDLIYYGVESANENVLRFYRKKIDMSKVKRAVDVTKKAGIAVVASFILGAPMETREDCMRTINYAIKLNPDYAQFSLLTPYPGTELYDMAEKSGWILTKDFDRYTAAKPVLKNFHLSPDELKNLLSYAYRRFYLRPSYLIRKVLEGNASVALSFVRTALRNILKHQRVG
ncbi:B12-binding domain-containing radical SAM protein [Geoglobus acetivorans]|uniref:B12-binding domain-containing radical SAM protein n=1 Tax=Geoglobus acetivorans TaxID=565033 RepID=A0ABZ3H3U8_GEOAI|nr:radical SAM protein [Geoglobus acetivorans]